MGTKHLTLRQLREHIERLTVPEAQLDEPIVLTLDGNQFVYYIESVTPSRSVAFTIKELP